MKKLEQLRQESKEKKILKQDIVKKEKKELIGS